MAKVSFYVQIEPEWSSYRNISGEKHLRAVKATRITQSRPAQPKPGSVTIALTVQIPDGAFYPLRPEAVVVIPEDLVRANLPIQVEATDPDGAS